MIRAFIVEDEQPALERLKDLIDEITDVEIIGSNPSGKEAVQQIDSLKPDLLFLDIQLTDISGIDVLR